MKFTAGLRMLALLRRISLALEGIHEQAIYRNERQFPPIIDAGPGKPRGIVISRGKPEKSDGM